MSNRKTVCWGVIGTGWFGEVHVETLSDMPGIDRRGDIRTASPQRLAEVADRFHVAKRYANYHDLLADPAIDVVGVTTHIKDHRDVTIDALRSGKHVFLEKPMAPTVADCDKILAAAREAKGSSWSGTFAGSTPRGAGQTGDRRRRIGKIVSMHARRNLSKAIGRQVLDSISALMGDGIHDGDLMLWFSGAKPVSVYAQEIHPGSNKYPDGGWAMARLDSGAIAVIESIWHLPETTPYQIDARMEMIGTERRVVHQLRRGGAGDPRRQGQPPARHALLAAPVWQAVRYSAGRVAVLCRLRGRRSAARANHARGVAQRRRPVGRRRGVVADRADRALLMACQIRSAPKCSTRKHFPSRSWPWGWRSNHAALDRRIP